MFKRSFADHNPIVVASEAVAYKVLLFGLFVVMVYKGMIFGELSLGAAELLWIAILSGFAAIGYRVYRQDLGIPVMVFSFIVLAIAAAVFWYLT